MSTAASHSATPPVATLPLGHGHAASPSEATVTPAAAARALRVRRETVHRWVRDGKLPVVLEANPQGRPVRRIPVSAVEELVRDGVRGPEITLPAPSEVTGSLDHGHAASELVERLQLVEQTASTALAQLAVMKVQAEAAVSRLDAPVGPWWRRRRERRERQTEATAALRQLVAIPEPPELP